MPDIYIQRPHYEGLLAHYRNTIPVKVLKGIRRCGKSTLLRHFAERLVGEGVPPRNIFYKRFDEFGLPLMQTADELQSELLQAVTESDQNAPFSVILDEIQEVEGWERVVRSLHTRERTDVYITGSNAYLMSSELSTLLSGRYVELDVYPLSFKEYARFRENTSELSAATPLFNDYLLYGGMPSLFDLREYKIESIARELSAIYDTVILKDVAKRFQIRDYALLEKLAQYVFSSSGNLFSTRKIVSFLTSIGVKTSHETIDSYLRALERALVITGVAQVGLRGKKILQPLKKYYPTDTGLRNLASGLTMQNYGTQLENVVYCELVRRGFAVSVGASESGEVDFVAKKADKTHYYQVCTSIVQDDVYERELRSLQAIGDSFPKTVLVADSMRLGTTPSGIVIENLLSWLWDFDW